MTISYVGQLGTDIYSFTTDGGGTTSSLSITTDIGLTTDNALILGVSYDSYGGDLPGTDNHHCTVSATNITWTLIEEVTVADSGGSLNSGVVTALWLGQVEASISSGAVVAVTFDGGTEHATVGGSIFSVNSGNFLELTTDGGTNPVIHYGTVVGYPSETLTGFPATPHIFFRSFAREQSTTLAMTPTSGFTTAWDLRSAPNTDLSSANQVAKAEFKISSNTSETSDPSGSSISADIADIFVAFNEYTLPITPPDPPPTPDPLVPDPEAIAPSTPEQDVMETWSWRTAITTAWDSTEHRVRLMPGPIRTADFHYILDEQEDLIEWQDKLYEAALSSMAVPYYQYATKITALAAATATSISFKRSATRLTIGDTVMIRNLSDRSHEPMFRTILTLTSTGGTIDTGLDEPINHQWSICPVHDSYVNTPQFNMSTVGGEFHLLAEVIDRTKILNRSGSGDLLDYFNGILIVRSVTLSDITHQYIATTEDFATAFGARLRVSAWAHPRLERAVRFFARNPSTEFDTWMQRFDHLAGALKPFYISSGLKDLDLFANYSNGDDFLKVVGSKYTSDYEDDPVYQQLSIRFSDGVIREYSVASASIQLDGNDKITLNEALPDDLTIVKISYLYRVRMATDTVTVKHQNNRAYFSFAIRGTVN